MLEIENVTVTFPDGRDRVVALDDVSLAIKPGQLMAVVGESGSGKSTLLSVAAGLIEPDSGRVRANGERGIIFQQSNLVSSLNTLDQLLIVDHMAGRKPRREKARELLEYVGLPGMEARRITQLSGGQRQRINIARALMADPEVLLADEPTAALDSSLSRDVAKLLRDITDEQQTATMFVTHDRSLLEFADNVVTVKDGKLASGS